MENPILVERTRGNVVESFHRGSICMVNQQGEVAFSLGNINQISFTRSALKLFQSLPLVASGAAQHFGLSTEEIAVTCGSHNAEKEHVDAVLSILSKIGLEASNLKCGPQMPTGKAPRKALQASGEKPQDIHNNCSGKHAGFLALCQYYNWPTESYLHHDHPLQKLIKTTVAGMMALRDHELIEGEDGCSAPNYATSLYHQALGYKNLVCPPHQLDDNYAKACETIINACARNPLYIAGRNRFCTDLTKASQGLVIGKTGADGVFCMAFPKHKMGCAIKIDDGKMGPQYFAALAVVKAMGIRLEDDLSDYVSAALLNWNKHETGEEKCSEWLYDKLQAIAL